MKTKDNVLEYYEGASFIMPRCLMITGEWYDENVTITKVIKIEHPLFPEGAVYELDNGCKVTSGSLYKRKN